MKGPHTWFLAMKMMEVWLFMVILIPVHKVPLLILMHLFCLKCRMHADMHTTLGSWRIRKAIRNFLFLDQLSAFGRKPRFWDARRLREIYATHSRLTPLWSSWKERRVENHKLDVSFGTSLVAGLGVSFIVQEIYDVMHPDKVDGGIVWLYLCLAFFTFVLRRQFNRR